MPEAEASALSISPVFGVVAPGLGWVPSLRFLLRRARILRLLSSVPFQDFIEVGCGAGALLHELALGKRNAVGLESSVRARDTAQLIAEHGGGAQQVTDLPDAAWLGSRDLVCAFEVLEHIEDDDAALKAWLEWLKPGGKLCVSVPAHRHRWGHGDEWAGHWRRYDRSDLLGLLQRHGLEIEHFECYGFPLANLSEWLGERTYRKRLEGRGTNFPKTDATHDSGVDRAEYLGLFRRMDTPIGRWALRFALFLQAATDSTDWGSGYLVLARKP